MRKLLLVTALVLSGGLCATAASAQETGFYARANVGNSDIGDNGGLLVDDSDTAIGIGFGWRFLPWLAVETGYNRLGESTLAIVCGGSCPPGMVGPSVDLSNVELGLAARVPFGDSGFFGVARAGMHRWDFDFGDSENDPYYGVGVGYAFNERYSLSLNFDRYELNDFDADRIGLGFEIAF